jgi:hypothetical protein
MPNRLAIARPKLLAKAGKERGERAVGGMV